MSTTRQAFDAQLRELEQDLLRMGSHVEEMEDQAVSALLNATSGPSGTRTGTVLMNSPTIRSDCATSAGRPETVAPNTTSSRPDSLPTSSAQAA